MKTNFYLTALAGGLLFGTSCKQNEGSGKGNESEKIQLKNFSVTPPLIKPTGSQLGGLEFYSLISSDDSLKSSPGFRFGGSADGSGFLKNTNGDGFIMMVNHEDNYSVSRITLDKTLQPVKGEYVLNSDGGQWRLCSGTLATPQENGFGPVYLSTGESDVEAQTHQINPFATALSPSMAKPVAGLGHWSGENSVPLHKDAYPGKTVVLIGEDASDASGGQLVLYVGGSIGDLDNGTQYMLRRTDGNQKETDMKTGQKYDVEFVKIDNHKTVSGRQIQAMVDPLKAIKFGRVEDIDYRKGSAANAREVYFNVTGQKDDGVNADRSRTVFGRTYRLVMDASNPTKGKLECILDGDDRKGPAGEFQNPDNICATTNYVYIQEDSNTYGTETHDAFIYQYEISTGKVFAIMEIDHKRDQAKYHLVPTETATKGNWEYGSLVDISDVIGIPNTFTLAIQPHTWRGDKYKNPDKGVKQEKESQASQIILIKNLPR